MRTYPESLAIIEDQIRGYIRGERGVVFCDNDAELTLHLVSHYQCNIRPSSHGGFWIYLDKDSDLVTQIILDEITGDIEVVRAKALGFFKPKNEIDLSTIKARDTIGSDGTIIKTELIDASAPDPEDNQVDVDVVEAFNRRVDYGITTNNC